MSSLLQNWLFGASHGLMPTKDEHLLPCAHFDVMNEAIFETQRLVLCIAIYVNKVFVLENVFRQMTR